MVDFVAVNHQVADRNLGVCTVDTEYPNRYLQVPSPPVLRSFARCDGRCCGEFQGGNCHRICELPRQTPQVSPEAEQEYTACSACRRGVSRGELCQQTSGGRAKRNSQPALSPHPPGGNSFCSSQAQAPASPWQKRLVSRHAFRQSAFRHWISKSELHHGLFSIFPLKRQTSSQSTPALRTRTLSRSGRCAGGSPYG
jgi:hypothetical protein